MAPPISMMMQLRAVPRGLAFPAAFNVNGRSVSPVAAAANAMVPSFRASRLFMSVPNDSIQTRSRSGPPTAHLPPRCVDLFQAPEARLPFLPESDDGQDSRERYPQ